MFLTVSAILYVAYQSRCNGCFQATADNRRITSFKVEIWFGQGKKIIKLISRKRFYKDDNINYMNISYLKWALLMHCIKSFVILPCSDALCNN